MKIESMDIIPRLQEEMNKEMDIAIEKVPYDDAKSDKEYSIAMAKHEAYLKCLDFIKDAMTNALHRN